MDKYLLFAGHNYYPLGGWDDFKGKFSNIEDCKKHLHNIENEFDFFNWAHIVHNDKIILWAVADRDVKICEDLWSYKPYDD